MHYTAFVNLFFFATCSLGQAISEPTTILEVVKTDPDLRTFWSIIQGTGGGLLNWDIEPRLEETKAGRNYALLAPVNAAFDRIPKGAVTQLKLPQNYPLLLSLIRNHIVEAPGRPLFPVADAPQNVTTIEGYTLTLASARDSKEDHVQNGYYKSTVTNMPVVKTPSGGVVYKISRLIDPFGTLYGISKPQAVPTALDSRVPDINRTMTDLVSEEPRLSVWLALMKEVLPAILKRLSDRRGPEGVACTTPHPFTLLPDNEAFYRIPVGYSTFLRAPFNFALSSHLLAWGITVPTCANFTTILGEIRSKGKFEIFSHRADINLTISESSPNSGELMVNNARVLTANRCAGNGCVWIVDRLLDPVYGLF